MYVCLCVSWRWDRNSKRVTMTGAKYNQEPTPSPPLFDQLSFCLGELSHHKLLTTISKKLIGMSTIRRVQMESEHSSSNWILRKGGQDLQWNTIIYLSKKAYPFSSSVTKSHINKHHTDMRDNSYNPESCSIHELFTSIQTILTVFLNA